MRGQTIENRIFEIRGHTVMIDRDLAELYGVSTMALNQGVKRNLERFPDDFMFRLTPAEAGELITNCDRFASLKHSPVPPCAFTENGVAMLSSVLRSPRAISVNIEIMRAFTRLRLLIARHKEIAAKLGDLERRVRGHDTQIGTVFDAIRGILESSGKRIGFKPDG